MDVKYTASGYGYYTDREKIFIVKHNIPVTVVYRQTLSNEGVEEFVERFGLLYDELLYSSSSYKSSYCL